MSEGSSPYTLLAGSHESDNAKFNSQHFFFFTENTEPSLFQRVVGLFSSKQESEIQFSTNDIEMTTFKVVTGQSPNMLPTMCCSAANSLLNTPRRRGLYSTALWSPVRKQRQHSVHKKCSKKLIFPSKDIILSRCIPSLTSKPIIVVLTEVDNRTNYILFNSSTTCEAGFPLSR